VLVLEAGGDYGNALEQMVLGLNIKAMEYEPIRWDYYVNYYPTLEQQRRDSKMTWRTADGEMYVGKTAPSGV
jgi:choline dehydrogenase